MSEMVPQLRFKQEDGSDFPDWRLKRLGEITTLMQSGLSRLLNDRDIGLPMIRSNNVQNGLLDISEIKYWFKDDPQGADTRNYFLAEDDLLVNFINSIAQIGKIALYKNLLHRDTIFTTNIMRLRFNEQVDPDYVFYFFNTHSYEDFIQSITKPAVNQASFTKQDFQRLPVPIPCDDEQTKIASFLSAVDKKIGHLERRLELLQTYKRGVMQKLFSREVRFKREDGSAFPDWELVEFGRVFDFIRTNSLSRAQLTYEVGTVQNIHYGDIHTKFAARFEQEKEKAPFVSDHEVVETLRDEEFCKVGDLVIADASEDYKDIGKTIEIVSVKEKSLIAGLHTYIARPLQGTFITGFPGYLMQSNALRNQITRLAQGISVLGISKTQLAKMEIPKPHPEEQQKIAAFLSTLDAKLDTVSTQISQVQRFKKGLLQQMFV